VFKGITVKHLFQSLFVPVEVRLADKTKVESLHEMFIRSCGNKDMKFLFGQPTWPLKWLRHHKSTPLEKLPSDLIY
jgi:hypothetical protein